MSPPDDVRAEIVRLHEVEGWKPGTIARQLKVSRRWVRRVLAGGQAADVPSKMGPIRRYLPQIEHWLEEYPSLRATRVHQMLVQRGFAGSVRTVREHVARLRPARAPRVFLEVSTLPGEQAQVDWAHVGKLTFEGHERALGLFVMVLGHSRAMWGEFVLEQTAASMARSLCRAAVYFGGLPRVWLFDNTKAVVLQRVGMAACFHPQLVEVAGALRVQPRLCAPYQAHEKGKVERGIRYLRESFLAARKIRSVEDGNAQLLEFLRTVADERAHPAFKPRRVREVFLEEQKSLLALPSALPDTDRLVEAKVNSYARVPFDTNLYAVPAEHAHGAVTVRASDTTVRIFSGTRCVATHPRSWSRHRRVPVQQSPDLVRQRRRATAGRDRLRDAAPHVDRLLQVLLEDGHNIGLCTARLLKQLDLYGPDIFRAALDDVLAQRRHDLAAFNYACEAARRRAQPATPVAATFGPHVDDHDVIPHDLDTYDDD